MTSLEYILEKRKKKAFNKQSKKQNKQNFFRYCSSYNSNNNINQDDLICKDKNLINSNKNFHTILNDNENKNKNFSLFKNNLQNKNQSSIIDGNFNVFR